MEQEDTQPAVGRMSQLLQSCLLLFLDHFIEEYTVGNRYLFLLCRFENHEKKTDIADPSFNFIIFIHDNECVIQLYRVIEENNDSCGYIRQDRPLRK